MKIKLDENMPRSLAADLANLGHDADTVHDEQLDGSSDEAVLQAAWKEARMLVTQDVRFADKRRFGDREHPGVVLIRVRSDRRTDLIAVTRWAFSKFDPETWRSCTVTVTENRVRSRSTRRSTE